MLFLHDKKAAFIHIPKTGGQTVEHVLGHPHKSSHHSTKDADQFNDYFRFCFVRDPLSRYISAHRYTLDVVKKGWVKPGHLQNHPVREIVLAMGEDAEDIDRFTKRVIRKGTSFLFKNIHFREQLYWVERCRPTFIGRTDRLDQDLRSLGRFLDMEIPEDIPRINASTRQKVVPSGNTIDLVRKIYALDFRVFGFGRSPD